MTVITDDTPATTDLEVRKTVLVWDIDTDETREVTPAEAAAGLVRYARRELGPGTAACGEAERQAMQLLKST